LPEYFCAVHPLDPTIPAKKKPPRWPLMPIY
jgi:hypothetical protein